MSYPVFFTPRSKETLVITYDLIINKFGQRAAKNFINKAEKIVKLISEQPYMFRASALGETVRIAFVTKQCSLFYEVKPNSINLLFFWDNRQQPVI